MAVLVEALSVIIRRKAIARIYPGGWDQFVRDVPNQTLCFDDDLCRVGFMGPADVDAYVSSLENRGLVFRQHGEAVDLAVVDQLRGPTVNTPWLEFGPLQTHDLKIAACWAKGHPPDKIAFPQGWRFKGSLSENTRFVAAEDLDDRMKFLRRDGDTDVYLDLRTGKEVYTGRPQIDDDGEAAILNKVEKLFHEALAIENAMQPLAALGDTGGLAPHSERLRQHLLPQARDLVTGIGQHMAAPHFLVGLIHRILLESAQAEAAFRRSYELHPGLINTVRELVRCLGEQDRHAEALPFAREGVEQNPDDAGCWGNLAMCLIQCGERVEAEEALRQALLIDPTDPINRTIRDNFDDYFKEADKHAGPQSSS